MNGNILMLPGGSMNLSEKPTSSPHDNIFALPGGSRGLAVREIDDPDLMVNMVNRNRGHIQRRQDRKDAWKRSIRRADEDRDQQMRDLALISQFSAFGVLIVMGLML